jgi:lysophospholipase L1-like esterase
VSSQALSFFQVRVSKPIKARPIAIEGLQDISLNPDGQARPELFVKDRLHFNADGYKLLAARVRPFLPNE